MKYVYRELLGMGIWLCLAIASLIVLAVTRNGRHEVVVQSDRLLPKLNGTEPRLLALISGDKEITLEKRSSWYAQSPFDMPANSDAVNEVIRALQEMRIIRPLQNARDEKSNLRDMGVEPAKFTWRIAVGDQQWTLKFGQRAPGMREGTYVSLTDSVQSAPRFYVVSAQLSSLDVQPERMLDSRLLPRSVESVRELVLETSQVRLHARRNPHSRCWFTVEPPSLRLAPERIATLFRGLSDLRIGLRKPPHPADGLRASVTIKLMLEAGETTVQILDGCDNDQRFFWTQRQDDAGTRQACIDTAPLLQVLPVRIEAWYDTQLFTLRMDEVESVTARIRGQKLSVSREGMGFVVNGTESNRLPLEAGNSYLEKLVSTRGELVHSFFPAQALDEYVELRSSTAAQDGDSLVERLSLGPSTSDGGRLVKRTDDGAVLKLDRSTLEALELGVRKIAP
jgi:hypothetical protein